MPQGTGERFKIIAEELFDGNVSEFARNMQMKPGAFNKYMKGDTMPGGIILKRLISLDINATWLLSGIPPMKISDITESGVIKIKMGEKKEPSKKDPIDYFAHIDEDLLTETERHLLAEARSFSVFLQKANLPLQVKRLILEIIIEHISQEIVRLRNKDS